MAGPQDSTKYAETYYQAGAISRGAGSPPTPSWPWPPAQDPRPQPLPREGTMGCVAGMQCGFVCLLHPMPTLRRAPLPWQRIAKSTQRETAPGRLVLPQPPRHQGKGFHGNADITRLSRLRRQALNGGAWVFPLQPLRGGRPRGPAGTPFRAASRSGFKTQPCP